MARDPIPDAQLAASIFIIQIVVIGAVMIGALVSRYWRHRAVSFPWHVGESEQASSGMTDAWLLLIWLVLTLASLTLTALNLSGWFTIGFHPPELRVGSAAFFAFLCDLLFGTWFVLRSGGWNDSPFTSVLLSTPTFAILLNESLAQISFYVGYVVLASGLFFFLNSELKFSGTQNQKDRRLLNAANWILSSIMLALAAWIGLFGAK